MLSPVFSPVTAAVVAFAAGWAVVVSGWVVISGSVVVSAEGSFVSDSVVVSASGSFVYSSVVVSFTAADAGFKTSASSYLLSYTIPSSFALCMILLSEYRYEYTANKTMVARRIPAPSPLKKYFAFINRSIIL